MIDIENELFTRVNIKLKEKNNNVFVTSEPLNSPSSFPCVSIVEIDNRVYANTLDSSTHAKHAAVTYDINIYSNKTEGKKKEIKSLLEAIDNEFTKMGFIRIMGSPIPDLSGMGISRFVTRYKGIVSKDKVIYS